MAGINKALLIKSCINRVGRMCYVVRSNGKEDSVTAVLQPVWKRTKSRFEGVFYPSGEVKNDYSIYIGPADYDITELDKNDTLICDDKKYYFERGERVVVGDNVQYFTGVLKQVYEEDDYGY